MGRWRAAVLIGVHILAAIHIAGWMATGEAISPIEPSESMEFSKKGVINAGLVFFVLAIGSTLILGRWFCGWGCHLVALQDFARWLLEKIGIRPKPIRSRLLLVVPLLAAIYMFISPLTYKMLAGSFFPSVSMELKTDAFWKTFPSLIPALLTFGICGFAAIYVLGAKGFCSTGCPYGGFFGVADQLAPMRIRVTDACEGCGHCTAVCTSNVRVHEEVRDFGAVVDPGCMKCMDCVSVCPNEALYVGFGAPAMLTRPRSVAKTAPSRPQKKTADVGSKFAAIGGWVLLGAFTLACFVVFAGFDRQFTMFPPLEWLNIFVLTGLSLLLAWAFRGKSTRKQDLRFADDIVFGVLFLSALLVFRGLYDLVAFLFALGLAAVIAYVWLHIWLLFRRENVTFHRWRLRRAGALQPAGRVFLALNAAFGAFALHSALIQFHTFRATGLRGAIDARYHANPRDPQLATMVERGMRSARFVENWSLARMVDSPAGLRWLPESVRKRRLNAQYLTRWHSLRGETELVETRLGEQLRLDPSWADGRVSLGLSLASRGELASATALLREGLTHTPDHPLLRQNLGVVLAETGDIAGAVEQFRAAVALEPRMNAARVALGRGLLALNRAEEAIATLREAVAREPADVDAGLFLGQALLTVGDCAAGRRALNDALRAAGNPPELASQVRLMLAGCE